MSAKLNHLSTLHAGEDMVSFDRVHCIPSVWLVLLRLVECVFRCLSLPGHLLEVLDCLSLNQVSKSRQVVLYEDDWYLWLRVSLIVYFGSRKGGSTIGRIESTTRHRRYVTRSIHTAKNLRDFT